MKTRFKILKRKFKKELPYALTTLFFLISIPLVLSFIPPPQGAVKVVVKSDLPQSQNAPPPEISAKNVFILDINTRQVLYQKSADEPVAMASTTKLMTAVVALESFSLDQLITVDSKFSEGQDIDLQPGERLSVEKLLYALLVQSGNDAAETLAAAYPGGRSAFISAMNTKAAGLHLRHSVFQNPTGLDQPDHYSSAADLARLSLEVLRQPLLARIVSTENVVLSAADSPQTHVLANTNELLGKVPGVLGIKTGFTDAAGQALITLVDRDGRRILVVVLGSQNRAGDTQGLIDWIYSSATAGT